MANNAAIPLTSLDFATLKQSINTFLSSQQVFQGYNFSGAVLSTLTDILAWNTTYNAFYMNMLAAESNIDAQLMGSMISQAKSLNYTPRSAKSATANLTLSWNSAQPTYLLSKGQSFSSTIKANNYMFSITENIVAASGNGFFSVNLPIAEGSYFSDSYVMSYAGETLTFELKNPVVDTSSIVVAVFENNATIADDYIFETTLLGLNETSKVFFVQMNYKGNYEIAFGDGVVGYRPSDGSTIVIDYRVCHGSVPNGAVRFQPNFSLFGASNVAIVVNEGASNGSDPEDIESIRFNAPRHFETQERGIVPDDYADLLEEQFPEILSVVAYSGQDPSVYPPQAGKVFIAVNINNVDGLPDSLKTTYEQFLANKTMMTPVVVPAQYTYLSFTSNVKYNINITTLTPQSIITIVTDALGTYVQNELDDFGVTLYMNGAGNLTDTISNSNPSIIANDTEVLIYKTMQPVTLTPQQITLDFGIPLFQGYNPTDNPHPDANNHTVSSSLFYYGSDLVYIEDDGAGNLQYVKTLNDPGAIQNKFYIFNVGTINYQTGVLQFTNLYVNFYDGDFIKVYVKTASPDFTVPPHTILTQNDPSEINITTTSLRIQ